MHSWAELVNKPSRKKVIFLFKIILSLALLAVLAWFIDPREMLRSALDADRGILILALAVAILNRVLMAIKWNLLVRAIDVVISWADAVTTYFASTFAGIFLPPTVGGDAVRATMLAGKYSRTAEVISSILIERVIGLVVLAAFGFVGLAVLLALFAERFPAASQLAWIIGGSALFLLVAIGFLTTPAFGRFVKYGIDNIENRGEFAGRSARFMRKILVSCSLYKDQPVAVWTFLALTILENLLVVFRAWIVTLAFGVDVDILLFLIIVPIEQFLIRLPISFDGFGIREGLFLYGLTAIGVPAPTALAIGLTNHLLFIVAVTPGAWFLLSTTRSNERVPNSDDSPESTSKSR